MGHTNFMAMEGMYLGKENFRPWEVWDGSQLVFFVFYIKHYNLAKQSNGFPESGRQLAIWPATSFVISSLE